jgi:hypothetical protein
MQKYCLRLLLVIITCTIISTAYCQYKVDSKKNTRFLNYLSIPMAGNSWAVNRPGKSKEIITKSGVEGWDNPSTQVNTYFRTGRTGKINLAIRARVKSGRSKLKCRLGKEIKELTINNIDFDTLKIGTFNLENTGYHKLILSGSEKSSGSFAEITDLLISGEAVDGLTRYVKDEFYWGRRGPSVHLNYETPADAGDVEYFYNEITVPEGNDVQGSYFMANGFGEGYFGIQVNSSSERRILFSVWSPYKTDKPNEIPEDQKIILLRKGNSVNAGAFGNEGSGGQSYRRYYWKAGTTYRFLLKGAPSVSSSTDYTAWFFAPENGKWELIAGFRRPKTTTYLKRPHSFLENFIPENGNIPRMAIYSNQWVCNTSGKWSELKKARFTADATARKEARLDYAGGIENGGFFLKNCGFFNEKTDIDSWFARPESGKKPEIDFKYLP